MIDDKYLETRKRAFMYTEKRSGPRMEPCGTPHFDCRKVVDSCLLK